MITVPAGTTLTLRSPGEEPIALMSLAEVKANFLAELPPMAVLSFDGPGTRREGVLELVTSAGVTWTEAELRGGVLSILGEPPVGIVQRRAAARRPGAYAATGTAQVDTGPSNRLVPVSGHVEDISADGLLLRATAARDDRPHLPSAILRALLHVEMPWGEMTASVTTVSQRSDLLRGTFEWIDPADAEALREFCS